MGPLIDWMRGAASAWRAPETKVENPATPALAGGIAGPARDYPFGQRLERLLLERSAGWSERVALIDMPTPERERTMSHAALRQRIAVMVRHLQRANVQPGQVVAVHIERSADLVAAILAIWSVGGVYLPLDRAFPTAYLASLCDIARPALVLTTSASQDQPAGADVPTLMLDRIDYGVLGADLAALPPQPVDAAALIMFTSGSTGKPKGVRHSQLQLVNRLHWMWQDYPYGPGDVQAQRSPMNVMPSMWELLGGVLGGIPTAIAPERIMREPAALFAWLADQDVTHMTLTPQLIKLLLDLKAAGASHPARLRRVINGGPLSETLRQRFLEEFPGVVLLHDFGCTETNTYLHHPAGGAPAHTQPGYLPIANTTIHLLDAAGQPVAPGQEGEVYIAGPSLALDYMDLPELTAERFPAIGADGPAWRGRLFRTGEMARQQPDGTLRMTGRYDHQAKVNGLRVEVEQVELALGDHADVAEVAVVAQALSDLHTRLVAYCVPRAGTAPAPEALRDYLAGRLPPHMVPGVFRLVPALPRRPNGKIDRVTLQQQRDALPVAAAATRHASAPVLTAIVAELLGLAPEQVPADSEFAALGLDSGMLMSFSATASAQLGRDVPVASCFDHPSIARLAQHLDGTDAAAVAVVQAPATSTAGGIAIIGIALRVPGAADRHAFWRNLTQGVESVGPIPPDRWDGEALYDTDIGRADRANSKWGGFLADIDGFEPLFFQLSPREAAAMDPQQRLCLMEAWRALEDAGYAPDQLGQRNVGVFLGAREPDYPGLRVRHGQPPNAATLLGSDMSLLAARLSYFLNLAGPSMVVDTACSSSMTALHLACQSLATGESELALAGGVCLTLDPDFYVASSKLGIFSPTGHCRAFDAAADGFVHGEGVAFAVLKPVAAAMRDGDHVYAVIRGTAINQDGRSNGITAPNGLAQTRLQEQLYRRLGIAPASIGYVEAHGTGTALGDVVEVQALARSFGGTGTRCAIGSVKPNIGHLTTAAGLVGVLKAALCLHHRTLVPSINYKSPNPRIDFAATPFYVNTATQPWTAPAQGPRRAAVNSFGIGGSNGHCVLEEAAAKTAPAPMAARWHLVPLTGRTPAAALARRRQLGDWLREHLADAAQPLSAEALAYTLACGRTRFEHGWLLAFRTPEELLERLDGPDVTGCWPLQPVRQPDAAWLAEGERWWRALERDATFAQMEQLARLVAGGFQPRWEERFEPAERQRIALPGYPFQTERCWFEGAPQAVSAPAPAPAAAPLAAATPSGELLATVLGVLAAELGLDAEAIDVDAPLSGYGMESVKAINLRFRLEERLGVDLAVQDIVAADTATALTQAVQAAQAPQAPQKMATPEEPSDEELVALFQQLSTNRDTSLSYAY